MAYYKSSKYLKQSEGEEFEVGYDPGARTLHSGIYRCRGCGHEIAAVKGKAMQDDHEHTVEQGAIHWLLVVRARNRRPA